MYVGTGREQLDGGPQGPISSKGTPPLFEVLSCTEVFLFVFLIIFPHNLLYYYYY